MSIGTIGAGALGSNVARLLTKSGISATIANSHGPESLARLVGELGPDVAKNVATNLDSHFLRAKYFLPGMRRKKWGASSEYLQIWSAWPYPDEPLYRHQDENHWVHERLAMTLQATELQRMRCCPV
jgi:hypothetical protein